VNLKGKRALVTGASRGIGRATAEALAEAGAHVIVHYGSSEAQATEVVRQIRDAGGSAEAVASDLGEKVGAHRLAGSIRELGHQSLDILVANAGMLSKKNLETQDEDEFDRQLTVNVRAPFFLVQQLLPLFGPGASIVLLSSISARRFVGFSAYAASKGAIDAMVISLAVELGPRGIRVNAVAPGGIETELASDLKNPSVRESAIASQCLKRVGQPDDVASAILFLASDAARWVTGETLQVGGGTKL